MIKAKNSRFWLTLFELGSDGVSRSILGRSTPRMGGHKAPSPLPTLPLCQNYSQMVKDGSEKTPNFLAFFKLFLRDVKVEVLRTTGHFLMGFFMRPSPAHSLPRPFLRTWKLLRWYICHASFIHMWLVIPKKFQKIIPKSSFCGWFSEVFRPCPLTP